MNYIISGGEFNNKGAEAMTLITIARIRLVDSNAKIFFWASAKKEDAERYSIIPFQITKDITEYLINPSLILKLRIVTKNTIKRIMRRKTQNVLRTQNILESCDYWIDVSGFAVSSKFKSERTEAMLDRARLAKRFGIKMVIMPQSFGPFEYDDTTMKNRIREALQNCYRIYAREMNGYKLLQRLGLQNIEKAYDMVLVQREIAYNQVCDNLERTGYIPQTAAQSVAIIPNKKTCAQNQIMQEKMINLYTKIINVLSKRDYMVYLVPHSTDDIAMCKKIYDGTTLVNVKLIDSVMHSYEYQEFAQSLDFIIASRYHSIIHAYKVGTPAVILGWAEKYYEIAELFDQKEFIFQVNDGIDEEAILNATVEMTETNKSHREYITRKLKIIQENDYFSFLYET